MQVDPKPRPSGPPSIIEDLEARVKSTITIETEPTYQNLARCNWQEQSPLFRLPKELRNLIFAFAAAPHDDPTHKTESGKFAAQTGRFSKQTASTSLPRTCRRAWLESNALPLRQLEHRFWFCSVFSEAEQDWTKLSPPDEDVRLWSFLTTLKSSNRRNFEHLRLFASMWWLENKAVEYLPVLLGVSGACPRVLTITVRHTDLWLAEEGMDVVVKTAWLRKLLNSPSLSRLREIRLELETLDDTDRQFMLGSRVDMVEMAVERFQAVRTEASLIERGSARRMDLEQVRVERVLSGVEDLDARLAKLWPKNFHLQLRRWTLAWRAVDVVDHCGIRSSPKCREDSWIKRAIEQRKQEGESGEMRLGRTAMRYHQQWREEGSLLKFEADPTKAGFLSGSQPVSLRSALSYLPTVSTWDLSRHRHMP
jgi:hypothetical protein